MEYRQLGYTDINVSLICLGTMTWGDQNSESEAHQQLDYALDTDINFVDVAEMYPVPPKAETQGRTETYIGTWFASRKNRDKVILATKIAGPSNFANWIRNGQTRFDRKNITEALEGSLKRLQTDYVDLYQLHWPERHTNFFGQLGYLHDPKDVFTPFEETLEVLQDFVKQGKIRHIGVSNETPWGLSRFLTLSQARGYPRMVSIQNPYNLLNRSFEVGLAEVAIREQCGLLAYSPMAFGVLSGKYLKGQHPPGARLTLWGEHFSRYSNKQAQAATERYVKLAREHRLSPAQMALAYVNTRPFVTSNIIGATSMAQLKENIGSLEVTLTPEVLQGIEAIQVDHPNPSP